MRPAERILRDPNLASYLEENLPIRKTILLQWPLTKYWKPEETSRIQHCFISNIYSKKYDIIGIPYNTLNLNTNWLKNNMFSLPSNPANFSLEVRHAIHWLFAHIWNKIGTGIDKLLTIPWQNFRWFQWEKVSQLFRDMRRSNSASPNSWIGGDDNFMLPNFQVLISAQPIGGHYYSNRKTALRFSIHSRSVPLKAPLLTFLSISLEPAGLDKPTSPRWFPLPESAWHPGWWPAQM